MNANDLHDIIFYVMYASLAAALIIIIERGLFFAYTRRQTKRLLGALTADILHLHDLPAELSQRNSLAATLIAPLLPQAANRDRDELNDLIDTQYLQSKPQMTRGLCLLGNNFLQSRMEHINEALKVLLLRAGMPHTRQPIKPAAVQENGVKRYA
ncbi:MAG: MotA/TolQ/ExbB proton channel family protein [Symbiopectobacterium sp.]|uniref:MotA/TolQ/ExbB proton channel family protein n=1 Tax=Symbiopectobacterium sp. TaxID=2952789 RepID=UPI0039EB6303